MPRLLAMLLMVALVMAACGGASETAPDVAAGTGAGEVEPEPEPPAEVTATSSPRPDPTATPPPTPEPEVLRLNDLRVLGSHNSYHLRPSAAVLGTLAALGPELADAIDYSHVSLTRQLDEFGVRQFEIDVYADPDGGLYANRAALPVVGLPAESGLPELDEPGFKVLHTQDFDFETTCLTLQVCLAEIAAWSDSNPNHLPLMIMVELKEESVPEAAASAGVVIPELGIEWTEPLVTDEAVLAALDAELIAAMGRERIMTPDDVRGRAATLEEVVLADRWPTLDESRGKVLFALVNTGVARDLYRSPSDVLAGRVMFTSSEPGSPDAAFLRIDDPSADAVKIDELAAAGYLIRTRTDVPTADARLGRTARRDAALAGGAHFLSTDYYLADPLFETGYSVTVVDRCNPVSAPPTCSLAVLDD